MEVLNTEISGGDRRESSFLSGLEKRFKKVSAADLGKIKKYVLRHSPRLKGIPTENDLRLLALLREKDEGSCLHSFAVARLVASSLDFKPGSRNSFGEDIEKEGMQREVLLRSSMLHDIGKLAVPDAVLKDATPRDEGREKEKLNHRDLEFLSVIFRDHHEKLAEIRSYGIDPERTTFADALALHDTKAAEIIENFYDKKDRKIITRLINSVHDHGEAAARDDIRTSAELIRLADYTQALLEKRTYKLPWPIIKIINSISEAAQTSDIHKEKFDLEIAKHWINYCLHHLNELGAEGGPQTTP